MLAVEDVLSELAGEEVMDERGLPPGFRFHPTDEELINFYLASKVFHGGFCKLEIAEVDLNRCEPWELPEIAKMGVREWCFFNLRDRKYPTGLRTNRATAAGYWKATGKDKEVHGGAGCSALLGMKKTLVFYKGRAPRGIKTKWVMHEYRLDGELSLRHTCKEEWVICRVFHKRGKKKNVGIQGQNCHYHNHQIESTSSFPPDYTSLPPLLETPTTQNPSATDDHENDLKTLISPVVSHLTGAADTSLNWAEMIEQDPLFHEAGYSLLGLSTEEDDMWIALNKAGFHMMSDSPIRFTAAESWLFNP